MTHPVFFKSLLSIALLMLACAVPGMAGDGVMEINQVAAEQGLYPCDDGSPGFPCQLSRSGSYRLTSILVVSSPDTSAIMSSVDNLSIDLNGFAILGPNVCTWDEQAHTVSCSLDDNGDGMYLGGEHTRVRNGMIAGFGRWGIYAYNDAHIDSVMVSSATTNGIWVGSRSQLSGCMVELSEEPAVLLGRGGLVRDTAIRHTDFTSALKAGDETAVLDCVALEVRGGLHAGDGSLIAGSVVHDSAAHKAILVGLDSAILGCVGVDGGAIVDAGDSSGLAYNVFYDYQILPVGWLQVGINLCNGAGCP